VATWAANFEVGWLNGAVMAAISSAVTMRESRSVAVRVGGDAHSTARPCAMSRSERWPS
jgi:DUF917 family protein